MRSIILAAALMTGAAGSASAATYDYTFNLDRVSGWLEDISSAVRVVVGIDSKTNTVSDFSINGVQYNDVYGKRGNDDTDPKKWVSQYSEIGGTHGKVSAEFETGWAAGPEWEPSSSGWTAVLTLMSDALGNAYAEASGHSAPKGVCRKH